MRFDGYLLTCFYAPVYLLSTVVTDYYFQDPKMKNLVNKCDLHCALFLSMSQDVLQLYWLYGMVLPISMGMRKRFPALFKILTPDMVGEENVEQGKEVLNKHENHVKGWSNIPLLLCIVSHLVLMGKLGLKAIRPEKQAKMQNLDHLRVEFGTETEFKPLHELVKHILFKAREGPEEDSFQAKMRQATRSITKDLVYNWLNHQCFEDRPGLLTGDEDECFEQGEEEEESETSGEEEETRRKRKKKKTKQKGERR
jgi:hypothetical protein